MTLKPLPQQALTAARLRKMAADMILEAEALEAECYEYKPTRQYDYRAEIKKIQDEVRR